MKTQKLTILILSMVASSAAWARFVDPSQLVESAQSVLLEESTPQQAEATPSRSARPQPSAPAPKAPPTLQERFSSGVERVQTWWRERDQPRPEDSSDPGLAGRESRGPSPEQIEEVTRSLSEVAPVQVSTPGRKASPDIPLNAAGVPVFDVEVTRQERQADGSTREVRLRRREVPRLDVGLEPRVSRGQFTIPDLRIPQTPRGEARALPSPPMVADHEIAKWTQMEIPVVGPVRQVEDGQERLQSPVTRESIAAIQMNLIPAPQVEEKPIQNLSENQLRMLAALILFDKGNRCPTVIGLFHDLAEEDASLRDDANYFAGACALRMSLFSEALERLRPLASKPSSPLYNRVLARLLELPEEYSREVTEVLIGIRDLSVVPAEGRDRARYLMARHNFRQNRFSQALNLAGQVSKGHSDYQNARYIQAISEYSLNRPERAIAILSELRQSLGQGRSDRNLQALTTVNLARLKFQEGQHQEAHDLYRSVDREHPLWIRGLVEQGWSQLHIDDPAGAIGNMYSLHSPFFSAVYKPESFAIRTIGYLNICQYGDAYQTLTLLENEYRPWLAKLDEYLGQRRPADQAYDTLRRYLQGRSNEDVDGLPHKALREVARQRPFLTLQSAINSRADQVDRFAGVAEQIRAEQERIRVRMGRAQERYDQAVALLKQAETDSSLAAQVNQLRGQRRSERDLVVGYRYQLVVYEQGRQGFLKLREKGEQRLAQERATLRSQAGDFALADLRRVRSEITDLLEKNEFLRYEVFAGSGENIRFQAAGGQTGAPNRIPASIKPERNLSWSFRGEFWKDEIGAYRSTLRNNCPNHHGITQRGN